MNIGDELVLTNIAPFNPYDGHNEAMPEFVTIEVIEKHDDAKGEFTGETGCGYLAKGSNGVTYSYNYPVINEGYGDTPWIPYISNEDFERLSDDDKDKYITLWRDVTRFQCPAKATFTENNDFIEYCEDHQRHYYVRKGCFFCKNSPDYRHQVQMNMDEHKWTGWY